MLEGRPARRRLPRRPDDWRRAAGNALNWLLAGVIATLLSAFGISNLPAAADVRGKPK